MSLSIVISQHDERLRAMFAELAQRLDDTTPVMREIGEVVHESVMRNFRESRAPDGAMWKPSHRARQEGGRTLVDSAVLKNSIHVRASRDKVRVGTPVEYAGVHQFGAPRGSFGVHGVEVDEHRRLVTHAFGRKLRYPVWSIVRRHVRRQALPWGDIPARPFLGVRREDWEEIHETVMDYLVAPG